jgi:hypothetical protein
MMLPDVADASYLLLLLVNARQNVLEARTRARPGAQALRVLSEDKEDMSLTFGQEWRFPCITHYRGDTYRGYPETTIHASGEIARRKWDGMLVLRACG